MNPSKNCHSQSPFSSLSRRKFLRFGSIASATTALDLAFWSVGKASPPSSNDAPIRVGVVALSFYRVVGGIIQNVLEALGHRVEIVEGPHTEIFSILGQGDLDVLVAVWLPHAHQPLFQRFGAQAIELGQLYNDARFFWGIPDYLPDDIQSIGDLARPDVAARMTRVIQGIGPGAGITRLSQTVMASYYLEDVGYQFRTGTEREWIDAFRQGVDARKGVIIPLWQPQYLNQAFSIRRLKDPLGIFPGADRCSLVITKAFRDRVPTTTLNALRRIYLGINAVTEMDYLTSMKGFSPREAATQWMNRNPRITQFWLKSSS
ncbi:MAG: glycine betaine ABC transporter substrate-binding protein [Leptolyngbyaceae cyanobacterium bins.59]|nr:glycine betaine ABC transporter substrate-binding protein [Leptolyngbyaceae cyanobacterium bins.59]